MIYVGLTTIRKNEDHKPKKLIQSIMAQPLVRDIEGSRVNQIVRNPIRSLFKDVARYIEPEYACLINIIGAYDPANAPLMMPVDIVITSICWTLKWRPEDVPIYRLSLTEKEQIRFDCLMVSPISDHVLMFIGMAGLITMVEIDHKSSNYFLSEWRKLCETTNIYNIIDSKKFYDDVYGIRITTITHDIIETWQDWIKSRTKLRTTLLNLVFEEDNEREVVVVEMIDRVRMIINDLSPKWVQIMEAFPMTGCSAILLPAIVNQAVKLRKAVLAFKALHKEKYPYIRMFFPKGVDQFHHNYPDLYFAALIKNGKLHLGMQIFEMPTTLPIEFIINLVKQPIIIQPRLDEEIRKGLEYLGVDLTHLRAPDDEEK